MKILSKLFVIFGLLTAIPMQAHMPDEVIAEYACILNIANHPLFPEALKNMLSSE